ncbi:hypothetical protein GMO_17920 [Gluconobacter morbifer G707]|uniref:Uncharacterized protein n=1 Tax=Gluconobacter morbifer G707 TaxID=1088869 RepID=G6XK63_9PROT|nr:hypothetical protein GMO_17920 [Gluconobacter morbifer G707]
MCPAFFGIGKGLAGHRGVVRREGRTRSSLRAGRKNPLSSAAEDGMGAVLS